MRSAVAARSNGCGDCHPTEELGLCLVREPRERDRESVEPVHTFLTDEKPCLVPGRFPAGGHERRVVIERVTCPDDEEGRRQPVQVCVERRDRRIATCLIVEPG